MRTYTPDRWIAIKITTPKETIMKILAAFGGGYLHGDSWKLNSGVAAIQKLDDGRLAFDGYSGSRYVCHPELYGTTMLTSGVLDELSESVKARGYQIEILDLADVMVS